MRGLGGRAIIAASRVRGAATTRSVPRPGGRLLAPVGRRGLSFVWCSMDEKWRAIPGWPEYFVSSYGRVARAFRKKRGRGSSDMVLKPCVGSKGYMRCTLFRIGKNCVRTKSTRLIHRLVLLAFHGPAKPGMQCNHKDGNKQNNRIDNLEWVTPRDNNLHALHVLGRKVVRGAENGSSKVADLALVQSLHAAGQGERKIAIATGISRFTVRSILAGTHWQQRE